MLTRTRIAPSPTGSPHVGTLYIALFNMAFARKNKGKFFIRIEDTDQKRSSEVYEKEILDALKWAGISWDGKVEKQSNKLARYMKYAKILLSKGLAYEKDGAIWLKRTNGVIQIEDGFRGKINSEMPNDQVIIKKDGFPTYHLASVVDDHFMEITHVIRGEEWLNSTPKHLLLYEGFGWTAPKFYHVPLLLNPDKSKLSKRKNPVSILYYKYMGYLPEALVNYITSLSYKTDKEIYNLQDYISDFSLDKISLGGSVFDIDKLKSINSKYIRACDTNNLYKKIGDFELEKSGVSSKVFGSIIKPRMKTLADFAKLVNYQSMEPEYNSKNGAILCAGTHVVKCVILQTLIWALSDIKEWTEEKIDLAFQRTSGFWQIKKRELCILAYFAIMGKESGLPIFYAIKSLKRDIALPRLYGALKYYNEGKQLPKKELKALEDKWKKYKEI